MTAPAPVWLSPGAVGTWLRLPVGQDDDLLAMCSAAVEPQVQRARPDQWVYDTAEPPAPPVYTPDGEVMQAAIMLAARLYRRRNSPGGVESFAESIVYISSRLDPEIAKALHQGQFAYPGVG